MSSKLKRVIPMIGISSDGAGYLKLQEQGDRRSLLIYIDPLSIQVMMDALQDKRSELKPAQQVILDCIDLLQAKIENLVIWGISNRSYRANVNMVAANNRRYAFEINVIDGVIAARTAGAPIYVVDDILQQISEEAERSERDFFSAQAQYIFNNLDHAKSVKM